VIAMADSLLAGVVGRASLALIDWQHPRAGDKAPGLAHQCRGTVKGGMAARWRARDAFHRSTRISEVSGLGLMRVAQFVHLWAPALFQLFGAPCGFRS
jgi:hypothetical protein